MQKTYVPWSVCNAPMATCASSPRWPKQLAAVSRPYFMGRGSNGSWLASNPLVPCFRISPVGQRWPIMASVGGLFQRQAWQAAERRVSLRFVACIQKRRRSDPLPLRLHLRLPVSHLAFCIITPSLPTTPALSITVTVALRPPPPVIPSPHSCTTHLRLRALVLSSGAPLNPAFVFGQNLDRCSIASVALSDRHAHLAL